MFCRPPSGANPDRGLTPHLDHEVVKGARGVRIGDSDGLGLSIAYVVLDVRSLEY